MTEQPEQSQPATGPDPSPMPESAEDFASTFTDDGLIDTVAKGDDQARETKVVGPGEQR